MSVLRALGGDVAASEAGLIDAHEHLVAHGTPELVAADPDLLLDDPDALLADLAAFRAAGGGTLVEMTTVDYGRDLSAVRRLSARSGVHVLAATGFNKGTYCRRYCEDADVGELSRAQVADVGAERCGVVKFGTSRDRIEPWEAVALAAAARTHLETGCPILTHTEAGTMAEEQLTRLEALGVAPEAVVLGHLDRCEDSEVHLRLAARGAYLSLDQVPKPKYATEAHAVRVVAALARRGLHGQVVVGADFARRSYFVGMGGGRGLGWLPRVFRGRLAAALDGEGLPGAAIAQAVLHDNPVRALRMRS